jgi:hypothetical protein
MVTGTTLPVTSSTTNPSIPETHDTSSAATVRLSTDYGWMDRRFPSARQVDVVCSPSPQAALDVFLWRPRLQSYAWVVVFFCASLVMLPLILRAVLIFPAEVATTWL